MGLAAGLTAGAPGRKAPAFEPRAGDSPGDVPGAKEPGRRSHDDPGPGNPSRRLAMPDRATTPRPEDRPADRRGFLRTAAAALAAGPLAAAAGVSRPAPAADLDPAADGPADDLAVMAYTHGAGYERANLGLILITRALRVADALCGRYLDDHPDDCPCGGCTDPRHFDMAWARDDVEGVRWGLNMAVNVFSSCTVGDGWGWERLPGETFGDDLRSLAALSDRLDALAADGEDRPDAPVIVSPADR